MTFYYIYYYIFYIILFICKYFCHYILLFNFFSKFILCIKEKELTSPLLFFYYICLHYIDILKIIYITDKKIPITKYFLL